MMTPLLSTYVAYYVEFRQSNENLKLVLIWIMFVLCDRLWGITQCYSSVSNFIYIQDFGTVDHSQIPEACGLCH